jgi:hypothetical protein
MRRWEGAQGAAMEHFDHWEFERAKPLFVRPGLLAGLACSALGCLAVGALLGLYFGMNQVSLF